MSAEISWKPEGGALPLPAGRLQGRGILVTGAAQGIGRAVATLFAAEGARVALLDINEAELRNVARQTGGTALACDLRDEEAIPRVVDAAAAALGRLDGVVNAAGIHDAGSITETSPARWREVLEVNLTAPFLVCRAALQHLAAHAGSTIVNISSGVGLAPFANRAAYATSKGGLITLGKVLAMELAPSIRVNTVCPGLIDTPMTAALVDSSNRDEVLQRYALRRLGHDVEVAQAVLFLSTTASSFVTGVTLAVDGGRTFH